MGRVFVGVLLLATAREAGAQSELERWSVEVFAGTAWSLPTPLVVRQRGEPDLRLRARWETRPWRDSPYYAYRFGRRDRGGAWEAELLHHKLYLANPPAEVQRLEVTHGYNLVTANRVVRPLEEDQFLYRVGVGLVVAHPEGRVRGRELRPVRSLLGGGYHVAGGTFHLSAGRRVALGGGGAFLAPEAKLTASWARAPAGDVWLTVPNVAVHALAGLGYARRTK
jgi:hypothetical protein